jgi:hypothetical protein
MASRLDQDMKCTLYQTIDTFVIRFQKANRSMCWQGRVEVKLGSWSLNYPLSRRS